MKVAHLSLLLLVLFTCQISQAQVVYTEPSFPTQIDDVTIYFDASMGNAGLKDFTGEVYAHTGVITESSSSSTDWKYVQGVWGTSDAPLMTKVSQNLYSLEMNITQFYGIPAGEKVEQLAFVFRSLDGSQSGRDTDGSDIYANVYESDQGLITSLLSPSTEGSVIYEDESINYKLTVNKVANVKVYDDNFLIHEEDGDLIDFVISDLSLGEHTLSAIIDDGNEQVTVNVTVIVIEKTNTLTDPPMGIKDGINYLEESYIFKLTAPHKDHVFFLCPANEYKVDLNYRMHLATDDSSFWIELPKSDFTNGQNTYQYLIDGNIRIADPYSEVILDPSNDQWIADEVMNTLPAYPTDMTSNIVTAFDTEDTPYPWQSPEFEKPEKSNLVIYELLMRDFLQDHSYTSLLDTLEYLKRLGVNAIELMPVNEFEGNTSWGYNPSFHMALDKYYGSRQDFKAVIDAAHSKGMAVILDVVFNHVFSQSPLAQMFWDAENFRPASDNPWLNVIPKHPFNVGYDVNHESAVTKKWVKQILQYWIEDYRIDGFRFDLSKGFTQFDSGNNASLMSQYDASRIAILKEYADHLWSIDPTNYVILEHFADNSEEKELSAYGMMLWGNGQHQFAEAAMGYSSDLDWMSYQQRGWDDPHVVGYAESHDEERMIYKLLQYGNSGPNYNTKEAEIAYDRAEAANAVFFSIPGPKMLWQFQELGYDYSINHCVNGGTNDNCRLDPKPIRWDYADVEGRLQIYAVISALTHLKKTYPTFSTTDFEFSDQSYLKRIKLNHSDMNAVTIANFQVQNQSIDPSFQSTGIWYEYFTGDSIAVSNVNQNIDLKPGEYRIYTDKKVSPPESFYVDTKDIDIEKVALFPNPTSNFQALSLIHSELNNIREVQIIDQMGKVHSVNYSYDGYELSIDTHKLTSNGIYIIKIVTLDKIYAGRIVKIE